MKQTDDKINILKQRQLETLQDMNNKLKKYGRCAVIRPVGFGKTYLISKVMQKLIASGHRVLYIYPTKVIANAVDEYSLENEVGNSEYNDAEFKELFKEFYDANLIKNNKDIKGFFKMSYMKFGIESTSDNKDRFIKWVAGFDMIVFDEMHIMGASNVKQGVYSLLQQIANKKKKPYLLGMTATPVRSFDNFNVIKEFFGEHYTKPYTLDDMVKDVLIKKPIYNFSSYADFKLSDFTEENYNLIAMNEEEAKAVARKLNNMVNCSEVLHRTIELAHNKFGVNTDYMKFISFFTTRDELEDGVVRLKGYMQKAFPDKRINVLKIYSGGYGGNVDKLSTLTKRSGVIDLIASINMLNTGYHVNDITGVIMLRNTHSNIIYSQQIGRAISVNSENPAIIFDFVQNLKMHPVWMFDNTNIPNAEHMTKEELDNELKGMSRLPKVNYSEFDKEIINMGKACSQLTDVYLIDTIVEAKEYIRKIEAVPNRVLEEAVKLYTNYENEMGIDDVAKYYAIPNIGKQVVSALKKNGYKLWEWDEHWNSVYESA